MEALTTPKAPPGPPGCATSPTRCRESPGSARARDCAIWRPTEKRSTSGKRLSVSVPSRCRRRGVRCGSARATTAICRPPGATRAGASSTATTTAGARCATRRSTRACPPLPGRCRRKCYIHPAVIEAYRDGSLGQAMSGRNVEACVKRLLGSPRRRSLLPALRQSLRRLRRNGGQVAGAASAAP